MKYKAKRTSDGFPSKLEASVYYLLQLYEKNNEIKNIKRQQVVYLTDATISYKTDFSYECLKTGEKVWVEAKGFEVGEWRLKKKLWTYYGPGRLQIYKGDYRRPTLAEEILPVIRQMTCHMCNAKIIL